MPTEEEFIRSLETIESYIVEVKDEIEETYEYGVEDRLEENQAGFTCRRGGYTYYVSGEVGDKYFQLTFPFNFQSSLASGLTEETAENYLDNAGVSTEETGEDLKYLAAKRILMNMESEDRQDLLFYLVERLSSPHTAYQLIMDDQDFQGFEVVRRIFPYEEDFSLSTFNDSVQSVVSVGAKGAKFLQKTFKLDIQKAGTEDERAEPFVDLPSEP